nr:PHD finger domain protein [Aspergillus niger CBS 513.88]|eukprot:XP_001398965.2 PHD finger domain protein [Aspergillus niger CBS 513.88]
MVYKSGVLSKSIKATEQLCTSTRIGDMSPHNGAPSSQASIETAPSSAHGTLHTTTTISGSPPSDSSRSISIGSSLGLPPSLPGRPSSIPSKRIEIPRLSAATTELLARVTGNLKGPQQRNDNDKFVTWNPSTVTRTFESQNSNSKMGKMRASSTIIELPTAPFVYSNNVAPPAVPQAASPVTTPVGVNSAPTPLTASIPAEPTAAIKIAPKPNGTLSDGAAPASTSLPTPQQPQTAAKPKKPQAAAGSRQRKGAANGNKRGKKRRRNNDSDGEDIIRAGDSSSDESDVAPTATQTKSGRLVNRPSLYVPAPSTPAVAKEVSNSVDASDNAVVARKRKRIHRRGKDAIIICLHCQRGHSPLSNSIVFCDECNAAWHQWCHDPPIGADVVAVKEKEWFCRECRPVQISVIQPTVVRSNPNLTSGPLVPNYPLLSIPKGEVGAAEFSADERRGFLSSLSHATLVELLMTISDNNPILPMFPENMRDLQSSKFAFRLPISDAPTPSTSVSGNVSTSNDTRDSASASTEGNKQNEDSAPEATSSSTTRRQYEEISDDDSEYEFQEHRLYPRAGNGFRLSLNVDDMDIMREDPACPTFSYSLHGPAQVRAQMNDIVPVWGT